MMSKKNVGILAVDTWLPETVRKNDEFWPKDKVEKWRSRLSNIVPRSEQYVEEVTPGVRLALSAIEALGDDPFQGVREIRVVAEEDVASDLEARAAQNALRQGGFAPEQMDILLSHPMIPDYLCVNPASVVHEKLGLRRDIPAFGIDGVCTSFHLQFNVASKFIRAGEAKMGLLTQASTVSRIMPLDQPFSPWFGDGGSAVVIGEVDADLGLLSMVFRTWGNYQKAFCASFPGGRWHEGPVVACNEDRDAARRMQLMAPDIAQDVISEALAKAGVAPDEVRFLACHQPASWFPGVVLQHTGLRNAKIMPTAAWTGNLSVVNIPIQLAVAYREGLLKKGDPVVFFSLASGMIAAGGVMRWAID